jgi:hypothetical protein
VADLLADRRRNGARAPGGWRGAGGARGEGGRVRSWLAAYKQKAPPPLTACFWGRFGCLNIKFTPGSSASAWLVGPVLYTSRRPGGWRYALWLRGPRSQGLRATGATRCGVRGAWGLCPFFF